MADEIARLKVVIDAEDNASGVIGRASSSLGTMKMSVSEYKTQMDNASKAVKTNEMALASAKSEYEKVTASTKKSTAALNAQKSSVESMIRTKKGEIEALEKSNSIINKGSQAYKDNQKAIQWTKTELAALEEQHKSISYQIEDNDNALRKAANSYKAAEKNVAEANKVYAQYSAGLGKIEEQEKELQKIAKAENLQQKGQALKSYADDLDTITKPMQVAAVGAIAGGVAVSKMAMDYESAFIKVKKTVDGTPEQLAKLDAEIKALSDDIPVSSTELAELAAVGGQLGVAVGDISKFTEVMAAMGTATNLQGEEGAATIARFMNVMGEEVQNVDRVGSAIVELGNNTATTEAEIATMAQRMGKFGKTVGMNTDQVLGYSAALSSVGIEAQLGGSAIGRTWLNIESAVNSGGKELATYAKYAGVSASEFKKQWNDSPSGAFNGLIKGLSSVENLTGALAELGVENIQDQQIVMALANNYDLMAKSLDLSANAYKDNTALMKEAETAYGSVANQLKLAKNDIQDAAISWGNVLLPEIRDGAQWVGNVAKSFENMSDAQKKTVVSGAKAAVVLGATAKVATSTIKGVGNTVEAIGNIKKATAAGGALAKFAPALAKVAVAAGPVALGVGTVTAAVILGKKVYDDYQNAQLEASREMLATSKDARDAAKNYTELNKLQIESKELTKKIDSGTIQGKELDNAKARLESIKNILEAEYKINIDQSDIDSALEKAKSIEARNAAQSRNETVQEMNSATSARQLSADIAKDSYELRGIETKQTDIVNAQTAIENLRAEWDALDVTQQNNIKTQADFKKRLNEAVQSAGIEEFEDYNYAYGDFGRALVDLQGKYNDLDAEAQKFRDSLERNEETLSNTKAAAENLAHIGLSEMEQGKTNQGLSDIALGVKKGMLDADSYARQAAVIQQNQESIDAVFSQGGKVLDDYVNQYISNMKQFGAGAKETAKGAALIKNGITDISKVTNQGTLDAISRDATRLARDMGEIPESKSIKINAEGDISVIDDATGKIEQIENKSINVSVTAEGNLEILDTASGKMETLSGMGAANLQVNASGNIEVLDSAAQKIAEIDGKTGEVTFSADSSEPDNYNAEDKEATVKYDLDSSSVDNYDPPNISRTVTYTYKTDGIAPKAKGTQNFGGGLAMVNDQTGISDPRELIIDNGRAFIPQGRNVILPLSRGAKVYTAAQTKRMMAALGIPQYASGKDNSDAFTSAKDSWTHTTKIKAVSVSEELGKWVEFSKKFTSNINDANDIQEEIYSLSLKQRDELNEDSEDYILARARMNDWQAYGDTAIDAFNRVRDRERQYVAEGKVLERDSHEFLEELGADMFDARVQNSKWWLDHETEYNDLSADDYIAGLGRMRAYTEEYYQNNIISAEEYYSTLQMLSDMQVDKTREQNDKEYEAWKNSADGYYEQRMLYEDWDEFGDSPEQFFERCIQRQKEFFDQGKISWEEYNEAVIGYEMDQYRAQQDEFDLLLDSYDKYIGKVNDKYDELISKKREAYETKNLKRDLEDAQAEKAKYAGAVTQKGKDIYNQAVKDIEEIKFEMEMNELEKKQTQIIASLEKDYALVEKDKKKILAAINVSGVDLARYTSIISADGSNIKDVLSQIYGVVKGLQPINQTRYGDTTLNINAGGANIEGMIRYATNAIAG